LKHRLSRVDWQDNARCAEPEFKELGKFFFSNEPREKYDAKNLCYGCEVRWDCLKYALENKQIWGIWGGKDEGELRRALSVNHEGKETRRQRFPNCPYCSGRPDKLEVVVAESPEGGRWTTMKLVHCTECDFTWRSRTSANAVNAYHADRAARAEKKKVEKEKAKEKAKKAKKPKTT
jgi:WhiB family redox-sensing transcriptional regulator